MKFYLIGFFLVLTFSCDLKLDEIKVSCPTISEIFPELIQYGDTVAIIGKHFDWENLAAYHISVNDHIVPSDHIVEIINTLPDSIEGADTIKFIVPGFIDFGQLSVSVSLSEYCSTIDETNSIDVLYECPLIPSENIVLNLAFDNNLDDQSPFGNHGQIFSGNPIFVPNRNGELNRAIEFDGEDDLLSIENVTSLNFNTIQDFSFSFWIKFERQNDSNNLDQTVDVFSKGTECSPGPMPYFFRIYAGNHPSLSGGFLEGRWEGTACGGGLSTCPSAISYTEREWVHIVFMKSADSIKLYVDNELENIAFDSLHYQDCNVVNGHDLYIGARYNDCDNTGPKYAFKGELDDFRVYNRALRVEEIECLFRE